MRGEYYQLRVVSMQEEVETVKKPQQSHDHEQLDVEKLSERSKIEQSEIENYLTNSSMRSCFFNI